MTLSLHSVFNTYEVGVLSASFTTGAGSKNTPLTGSFLPAFEATIEDTHYPSAITDMAAALQEDFGGTWVGSYSNQTNTYTISGSVPFKQVWSQAAKELFGFADNNVTFSNYATSSIAPGNIWRASLNGRVGETKVYELGPIATEVMSIDGIPFSLVKSGSAKIESWEFRYEAKQNIYNAFSSSLAPWTYQKHIEHVGARKPWVYFDTNDATVAYSDRTAVYKYTEFSAQFQPESSFFGAVDHSYNVRAEAVQVNALTDAEVADNEIPIDSPTDLEGLSGMYWPISASLNGATDKVLSITGSVSSNHVYVTGGGLLPTYSASNPIFNSNPTITMPGGDANHYLSTLGSGSYTRTGANGGSYVFFYTIDAHRSNGSFAVIDRTGTWKFTHLTMAPGYRRTQIVANDAIQTSNALPYNDDITNNNVPAFVCGTWGPAASSEGLTLFWSDGTSVASHRSSQVFITGPQDFDDPLTAAAGTIVASIGGEAIRPAFTFAFAAFFDRPLTVAESKGLRDWLLEDFGYV